MKDFLVLLPETFLLVTYLAQYPQVVTQQQYTRYFWIQTDSLQVCQEFTHFTHFSPTQL